MTFLGPYCCGFGNADGVPMVSSRPSSLRQEDIKVSSSPAELSVGYGDVLDAVFMEWTLRRNKLLQPHCRGGSCISQAFPRNIATLEQRQ